MSVFSLLPMRFSFAFAFSLLRFSFAFALLHLQFFSFAFAFSFALLFCSCVLHFPATIILEPKTHLQNCTIQVQFIEPIKQSGSGSSHYYLPYVGQSVHDEAFLPFLVVIQLQHGAAMLIQEEAFCALVPWVKRVHDDGLRAFDLTTTERTTLTVRLLEHMCESLHVRRGYFTAKHTVPDGLLEFPSTARNSQGRRPSDALDKFITGPNRETSNHQHSPLQTIQVVLQ